MREARNLVKLLQSFERASGQKISKKESKRILIRVNTTIQQKNKRSFGLYLGYKVAEFPTSYFRFLEESYSRGMDLNDRQDQEKAWGMDKQKSIHDRQNNPDSIYIINNTLVSKLNDSYSCKGPWMGESISWEIFMVRRKNEKKWHLISWRKWLGLWTVR